MEILLRIHSGILFYIISKQIIRLLHSFMCSTYADGNTGTVPVLSTRYPVRYLGITCKNQPRLYFSVGLKYRSTADGKIP